MPLVALLAIALIAVAAGLVDDHHRRTITVTSDEPAHVDAAWQLRTGPRLVANFDHPVLVKLLAAASLEGTSPGPRSEDVRRARRPFPWLHALLVLAAGTWALARTSPWMGVLVAGLLGAEPTLRGHAGLVHTDVPLAAFLVVAAAAFDLSFEAGRTRLAGLLLAGASLGAALATKYSAIAFVPVFLLFAGAVLAGRLRGPGLLLRSLAAVGTMGLVALAVLASLQVWAGRQTDRPSLRAATVRQFAPVPEALPRALACVDVLPAGLGAYAAGALFVTAFSGTGAERGAVFLGELRPGGFLAYFPVAIAVKMTAASVLLMPMAAAALALGSLRTGRATSRARFRLLAVHRCAWPLALGLTYLAAAVASGLNVGVRHVIPAFVFLVVAAAGAAETAFGGRARVLGPFAAFFLGAAVLEAAAFAGREIPFGNVLAGGPAGVRRILADSNVYWGQGQERVHERIARGDLGRIGIMTGSFDLEGASRSGIRPVRRVGDLGGLVDAVFVDWSAHQVALARNPNPLGLAGLESVRANLTPIVLELYRSSVRIEPVGDEFLLFILRPGRAKAPGAAAPSGVPGPGPVPPR